jgi:hypothetical protein
MRKTILILILFAISFLTLSNITYACPTYDFVLASFHNGQPIQRTFFVTPGVYTFNPETEEVTLTNFIRTSQWYEDQVFTGYVSWGAGPCGQAFLTKTWYSIHSLNGISPPPPPNQQVVFKILFEPGYDYSSYANFAWRSKGNPGTAGKMYVNGGTYPSTYNTGTTYQGINFKFRWDIQ